MPKRSWNQISSGAATQPGRRPSTKATRNDMHIIKSGSPSSPDEAKIFQNGSFSEPQQHPPTPTLTDAGSESRFAKSDTRQRAVSMAQSDDNEPIAWPSITRKVKACAACRKQKIKCDMDDDCPPCKRSLEQTLRALSLPSLPSLHTSLSENGNGQEQQETQIAQAVEPTARDLDQSRHVDETLAHVPIESLYELTRLRSLRGETVEERPADHDDFISRGLVSVDEAEKLFQFYHTQLDPYIYGLASKYKSLESLRRSSPLLTACICTVAASHQPGNSGVVYEICNQEFRRLVSMSMFERRISLDYLRALVIGSYWLSDVSWTLAGLAVRRASDINLHKFYYRIMDSTHGFAETPKSWDSADPEASIDPVRLWYLLYICDQHLSILYTRAPMIREDDTIRGWRDYLESPHASQSDVRISSQVALMMLLSQIREYFGVDATKAVPRAITPHINTFSHHLDKWLAHWSSKLAANKHIGNFPSKGILLHYHFGKLHLFSHVFRGLKSGDHVEPIPAYFKETASAAVSHATTILELLLNDVDIRPSIIGVPHYFHTMIAFACVVLLKVSDRYRGDLGIDAGLTHALIQRVIEFLRQINCGRYHLVHWMAEGLAKMLHLCRSSSAGLHPGVQPHLSWNGSNNNHNHNHDAILSPLIQDNVSNTLFNSVSEIPEQPSFLSLDPNFDLHAGLNAEGNHDDSHIGTMSSGGPFLPMLDGIDGGGAGASTGGGGGDYGLTDMSFNFV
ncbi:hypothetical protein UA08_02517 [Talaromyces atroroseus]|uniref:Xylanolytic transcriptional activator regulatory domain-containing protein n=1 Tax=Talaromyces atroroseus TaxID=1441469 RepID=A0A225ALA5_TALAT|nr:hypothetical protein UA08_02517 [Talaromyces atroroseus]OKL62322.1 hypothetical protein UA08_02517 [Talaromyces atroroseus]